MVDKTKIIFLGNSHTFCSVYFLPKILNKIPEALISSFEIDMLYISAGRVEQFAEYWDYKLDKSLPNEPYPITNESAKSPHIFYHFQYGLNKFKEDRMPKMSMNDIIKEGGYDIIVLGLFNTAHCFPWKFEWCFPFYERVIKDIRKISDAEIYLSESNVPRDHLVSCYKIDDSRKYFYNGEFPICKDMEEMNVNFNNIENEICKRLNLKKIRIREGFNLVREQINNEYRLMLDIQHPDIGIGRYAQFAVIYYTLFYNTIKIHLKDIDYTFDASKYVYKTNSGDFKDCCISVTKENKKIVDDIISNMFIK